MSSHQLERIKEKILKLRNLDLEFRIFGSSSHEYEFLPVKTEKELSNFEEKFHITLPQGYRDFLLEIGNGGAGPYYGLESLESSLFVDLDNKSTEYLLDPASEFPLNDKWNVNYEGLSEEEYFEKRDEIYEDPRFSSGIIRVSNYGCGIWINLVVNGPEFGNIWIDDICNDGGVYPVASNDKHDDRIDFLSWYELWLDESLSKINQL